MKTNRQNTHKQHRKTCEHKQGTKRTTKHGKALKQKRNTRMNKTRKQQKQTRKTT